MVGVQIVNVERVAYGRGPITERVQIGSGNAERSLPFYELPPDITRITPGQARTLFFNYVRDSLEESDREIQINDNKFSIKLSYSLNDAKSNTIKLSLDFKMKRQDFDGVKKYFTKGPGSKELPQKNVFDELNISILRGNDGSHVHLFDLRIERGAILPQEKRYDVDKLTQFNVVGENIEVTINVHPEIIAAAVFKRQLEILRFHHPDRFSSGGEDEGLEQQLERQCLGVYTFLSQYFFYRETLLESYTSLSSGGEEVLDLDEDEANFAALENLEHNMSAAHLQLNNFTKKKF